MREVTAFQVIFAKNPPVFSPSEIIQGTIQLGISAAIAFQNIQVHLFGRSFSKIVESNTSNFDDEYKGSETYLDKKIMVWGDVTGKEQVLVPGTYAFSFEFQLPSNPEIPSSYEDGYSCNIRHMIIANIYKKAISVLSIKKAFTYLQSGSDTSQYLTKPLPIEAETQLYCMCTQSGNVKLTAHIDRCGYCPGECIVINAVCANMSNRKLKGLRARIIRITTRSAQSHNRTMEYIYDGIQTPTQVDENETFHWTNQLLPIPSIPPTITTRHVKVSYAVLISALVPLSPNLDIQIPIMVGTSPTLKLSQRVDGTEQSFLENSTSITYQGCVNRVADLREARDPLGMIGEFQFQPHYVCVQNYEPSASAYSYEASKI